MKNIFRFPREREKGQDSSHFQLTTLDTMRTSRFSDGNDFHLSTSLMYKDFASPEIDRDSEIHSQNLWASQPRLDFSHHTNFWLVCHWTLVYFHQMNEARGSLGVEGSLTKIISFIEADYFVKIFILCLSRVSRDFRREFWHWIQEDFLNDSIKWNLKIFSIIGFYFIKRWGLTGEGLSVNIFVWLRFLGSFQALASN